jgi:hypothetical protein
MLAEAEAWRQRLDRDPSPFNRMAFHAAVGSYGRAYAAAQPLLADPPKVPAARLRLAEIAFQAGDAEASTRLLADVMPRAAVERTLLEFASRSRRHDRARPEDRWVPAWLHDAT